LLELLLLGIVTPVPWPPLDRLSLVTAELTRELLDLRATTLGSRKGLFAAVIDCCSCSSCCCCGIYT
jgi:hypothetical protein